MQNIKQVKKNSFDTLQLSLYIQLQVITIDMNWLYHSVAVWSACLVVWFTIFMPGSVSKYLEVEEDYQQADRIARMILLDLGY